MFEGLSAKELHHDERVTFLLIDVVNRADVWMVQGGRGLCLSLKSVEGAGTDADFFRQELQSDRSRKLRVFGLIDHTHPAAAQFLQDLVMGNRFSGFQDNVDSTPE